MTTNVTYANALIAVLIFITMFAISFYFCLWSACRRGIIADMEALAQKEDEEAKAAAETAKAAAAAEEEAKKADKSKGKKGKSGKKALRNRMRRRNKAAAKAEG